ncbi:MAG TPA: ROK family protein [Pirellulaceae bacterium]|jgi:glucokinase|nr:ROK family protein [Pirellulaceae bacterium]
MRPLFAGVDLGGASIKAAVATERGEIIAEDRVPTESHEGPVAVVERMTVLIERLVRQSSGELRGLGVGVPGLVDVATGVTKFLPNLPTQWRDVAVGAMLQERLRAPARLLNDVRAATLGELRFGHGAGLPDVTMAFFAVGTGVGGGIVVDGKLRLGPLGAAGELGHQTILPDGPRCGCGNRGCLEALASGPAIAAEGVRLMKMGLAPHLYRAVEGDAERVTPREMLAAAQAGDERVHEALVCAGEWIGIAAGNVVTILHPDLVVIGGGVAELGETLLEPIRRTIRERVGMFPTEGVRVERSALGERAGILGCLALAQEKPGIATA